MEHRFDLPSKDDNNNNENNSTLLIDLILPKCKDDYKNFLPDL